MATDPRAIECEKIWRLRCNDAVIKSIRSFMGEKQLFSYGDLAETVGGHRTTWMALLQGKYDYVSDEVISRFRDKYGIDLWTIAGAERELFAVQYRPEISDAIRQVMAERKLSKRQFGEIIGQNLANLDRMLRGSITQVSLEWIGGLREVGIDVVPGETVPAPKPRKPRKTAKSATTRGDKKASEGGVRQLIETHGGVPSPLGPGHVLTQQSFTPHDTTPGQDFITWLVQSIEVTRALLNACSQIANPAIRRKLQQTMGPQVAELEMAIRIWVSQNPSEEVRFIEGGRLEILLRKTQKPEGGNSNDA
ncbi:helix-turn-helix transcriptional regulator [Candidatus Berkelbacteria bacterium]|nr:helix-turn-helix transcriptional regulator [Candidatus Berkelbacteria bacterium]